MRKAPLIQRGFCTLVGGYAPTVANLGCGFIHATCGDVGHAAVTVIGLIQTFLQDGTIFVFVQTLSLIHI